MSVGPNQGLVYYGEEGKPPQQNTSIWVVTDPDGHPSGLGLYDARTQEYRIFSIAEATNGVTQN